MNLYAHPTDLATIQAMGLKEADTHHQMLIEITEANEKRLKDKT